MRTERRWTDEYNDQHFTRFWQHSRNRSEVKGEEIEVKIADER